MMIIIAAVTRLGSLRTRHTREQGEDNLQELGGGKDDEEEDDHDDEQGEDVP